ncbi:MAG: prepilin-type N-terminal cleavage/methylation domain-containing protein [Candidatus Sungbacteria bacterium]|nr:prepilin-type N-terminal cleavage/methylation domain-containing protein [Candidatus Sungbacteria bacterium]
MTFLTKKLTHGKKGFTLIELLVVIAIIGVLASIVLASLNTARKKSRDTRRVADMNQAKLALELYYDSTRHYPDTSAGIATFLAPTYIASWPTDPITGTAYTYYAGLNNRADNGAIDNVCSTAAASCQLFHTGATVEDQTITAMSSRAGGCPLTTTQTGCKVSLDETTITSATAFNCAGTGAAGQGCYDVIP